MRRFWARHELAGTAVIIGVVTLILYWRILIFPLSFDDLLHIRLVEGLDYFNVWLPISDSNFFRPFMFLPLMFTRSLFGYYPPMFVYSQNLLLATLNSLLVAGLAWRLWRRWPRSLAAGLLFCSYPFSYQVVAVFGNNIYLFLVGVILLALHTYLLALEGRQGWWLVTAVLFVIGLLSHELMILFGFFAALVQWAAQGSIRIGAWSRENRNWRALLDIQALFRSSPFIVFVLISTAYFIFYQFLPLIGAPSPSDGNLLWPRILYLLQGLVYPLAALGNQIDALATDLIIIVSLLFLIVLSIWTARKRENRLALLLGWGWWASSSLLLILTLPTDYILHGPRLNYLGSVGVCIIWAVVLDDLFSWRRLGRIAWTAVLAAIVLMSSLFVRGRVGALADLGSPVTLIDSVMKERPLAEGVMLVNFPSNRSPANPTFPIGAEHVALMGHHLFAEEIVWDNLNQVRPVLAVGIPELLRDPGYPFGTHVQSDLPQDPQTWAPAGAHVFISEFTETGVQSRYTGQFSPIDHESAPLAHFGAYDLLAATAVMCDGTVTTELTWQVTGSPTATTSLFVQALAANGRLVGQQDGPPLNIRPDLLGLPDTWQITDRRQLPLAPDAQPSQLIFGVYDFQTGARALARDANDTPLPDNAYSLMIQACQSD